MHSGFCNSFPRDSKSGAVYNQTFVLYDLEVFVGFGVLQTVEDVIGVFKKARPL